MGLSGKEGSVTTKFCWAVWRALIKLKSGSSRTLFASLLFDAMSEFAFDATLERFSFLRSSLACSSPRLVRMAPRSLSFSSFRSETDCWRDSRRNFLRILDRLACSRLRSLFYGYIPGLV